MPILSPSYTVEIKKNLSNLVPFTVYFRSVLFPFSFRSLVAIRSVLATRPPRRARNGRISRGTTVAKQGPIVVKMRIKGDIAPTQLLEALPSHKNPRAPADNVRHAAKHRKRNATERNETERNRNGMSTAFLNGTETKRNGTERNWKRFFDLYCSCECQLFIDDKLCIPHPYLVHICPCYNSIGHTPLSLN